MEEEYVNITTKATKMYSLWTRATIPWKIECEKDGKTRTETIGKVNDFELVADRVKPFTASPLLLQTMVAIAIMFIIFDVILSIAFTVNVCNKLDEGSDASRHCFNTF